MKIYFRIICSILCAISIISCTEDDYGKHSDIKFAIPIVESELGEVGIGQEVIIKGQNFVTPNTVSIDNISMKIISESENEIKAILPRIFDPSSIIIRNAYGCWSENTDVVKPIYPSDSKITVTKWPSKIVRGRTISFEGENVDLITQVSIGELSISVNGLDQSANKLIVLVPENIEATSSVITLLTINGGTLESQELNIEDPSGGFEPIDPIILLDFEDGVTHFSKGDILDANFTAQINRSGIIAPEGNNFFSFYVKNIASNWDYLGSTTLKFDPAISLIEFTDPHITFLYNSDDNVGNFQVKTVQGEKVGGSYFANGVTNDDRDAWMLRPTNGEWLWVTARLKDLINENWGGNFDGFDPKGKLNEVEFIYKQVNAGYWDGTSTDGGVFVNKTFKVNIDQVMITDGPYEGDE